MINSPDSPAAEIHVINSRKKEIHLYEGAEKYEVNFTDTNHVKVYEDR